MGWKQLEIDKVHLALIITGVFITIFCYTSRVIREKLLVGEATLGSVVGLIFGPHAANLINPKSWGNMEYVTIEICRMVINVRVFASGVELPVAYFQHHFQSIFVMLSIIMTFGWLVSAGFAYALFPKITFLGSLLIAGCITSTDPVLSALIVGEGAIGKRIPPKIRALLIAESGCNDGMAVPFLYFALKLLTVKPSKHAGRDWVLLIVLYECIFGIFFGCVLGVLLDKMLKWFQKLRFIDANSYYSLFFAIPLMCSGIGTIIGVDDLLLSFFTGVMLAWDNAFVDGMSECYVPPFIDQIFNLLFFTYFGSIIPWEKFNWIQMDLSVWRLIVFTILIFFFRRLPVVLLCKRLIPDIQTWKEALFVGHFGPIGVCAVYMSFVAKSALTPNEIEETVYKSTDEFFILHEVLWPIVSFVILSSIIIHGFSVPILIYGDKLKSLWMRRHKVDNPTIPMDEISMEPSKSKDYTPS
ncbi:plasma membrane/prospore membrane sodium ion/proton antiporter Nhe1/Sod2 [Schizosaccharomyces osmophilus]|uniref:Plasma membrane/prospore membrane sodium ion/proton antiporter Nhe1/Sod2 n=1 Tax=Schizosaccharomyces osmophilus TaxID=2545709 RepID=A0AAE9W861_9SCHI|nr:plasma membrane/prospore membrane sodium ion/proton antiporter Nhe1/Sod2 [Schizosaccharomyces osmophilus]WBW71124.1 plasma membrane/prospore membrane sodium ion/proton antiporter Nhe1/Sod2 [Schizosaccharomyces osmophilus]